MSRDPMKRWINHGRAALEDDTEAPKPSAWIVVRIYYVSAGDELLCIDSEPMTWQAADKLKASLSAKSSMAVRVETSTPGEPRPGWNGARLVVMPSQMERE